MKEAEIISEITGQEPLIDNAATKSAVLTALETSARVHIALHGMHNPISPMFQCPYVAQNTDGSAGEVYAHEVANLDLSHMELVSLSACETGLGRADESDNLLGLPAALFTAGVPAIVTTLWRVETNAANSFLNTYIGR